MKYLLVMGLLLAVGCTKEAPKAEVVKEKKTPGEVKLEPAMVKSANIMSVAVESRTQALVLAVNGRLTANEDRTWHVDSFTEGRILKLFANVGDRVTAGQLVAQMHSHEVHEARSEYQRAKTDLAKLQSQRSYAERTRDRMKRLLELKAASVEQTEHAESQLRDAEAAVKNAQTELERTRVHLVEFLDVPAEDHPEHKAGDFAHDEDAVPIKTRNGGTVIKRETSVGAVVKAADGVYVVSDLTSVWMIAALPEDQLGKVRVGMNAQVKVQAYPDEVFAGKIVRLGDQLDVETRTVPVRIALANPGQKLRPEMYAVAEIGAGGATEAIVMPQAALQDFNGQAVVFVDLGDGKYVVRPVRTGRVQGANVEVLEGVVAGDRVVSRGAFVLKSQMFKSSLAEE
ncbi:MAG: efflux RND transporter periplasmic adaptor subunit [Acidobacteria bacterium]|nr:efflux RND transporter periplasmic adaptor subunit [Acidobacteriota bacterium]